MQQPCFNFFLTRKASVALNKMFLAKRAQSLTGVIKRHWRCHYILAQALTGTLLWALLVFTESLPKHYFLTKKTKQKHFGSFCIISPLQCCSSADLHYSLSLCSSVYLRLCTQSQDKTAPMSPAAALWPKTRGKFPTFSMLWSMLKK